MIPPSLDSSGRDRDLATALADDPGRADWGGQRLRVWQDLVFVSALGSDSDIHGLPHVSVFRLPDLRYEGQWRSDDPYDMTGAAVDVTDLDGDGAPEVLIGRLKDIQPDQGTWGTVHLVSGVPHGVVDVRSAARFSFSSPGQVRVGSAVLFADLDLD